MFDCELASIANYFWGRATAPPQRLQRVTSELIFAPHLPQRRDLVCNLNLVRGRLRIEFAPYYLNSSLIQNKVVI
jgi:hypothetical protein